MLRMRKCARSPPTLTKKLRSHRSLSALQLELQGSLRIMASWRGTPSSEHLDPTSKWLHHVDEHILPEVGVEMLKLALFPFIGKTKYQVAQELRTPSQVYYFLLEKHFKHNKQQALQWFVHALSCLQSPRSRGKYLLGRGCQNQYDISLPAPPTDVDTELKFYECITKICDKAYGTDQHLVEKLKEQFSKKGILNANPEGLYHLPQIFIRLIQKEVVGPNKVNRLIKTFEKYEGNTTARWCLFYLNNYLRSAGMPQIPSMQGVTRGQLIESRHHKYVIPVPN